VTTITVPRAVLEKALEALEAMKAEFRALDLPYGSKAYAAGNQAAHGLRAALAQPDMHPQCAQGCEFLAMEQRRNEREATLKERGFE